MTMGLGMRLARTANLRVPCVQSNRWFIGGELRSRERRKRNKKDRGEREGMVFSNLLDHMAQLDLSPNLPSITL